MSRRVAERILAERILAERILAESILAAVRNDAVEEESSAAAGKG